MLNRISFIIGILFLGFIITGCAGNKRTNLVGEEKIVERMPKNPPKWLNIPYEERDEKFFFKGEATRVYDRSLGFRQAKANGTQALVEAIKIKARSEFSEAVKGINVSSQTLGRYLDNVIVWTSENVEVSGMVPEEEYYEKVAVRTYDGIKYVYNCFVRLSIPVENYLRARASALAKATVEAPDPEAKSLAEEVKQKLNR